MMTVSFEVSEDMCAAVRRSPDEFVQELRLAAAIYWYERGTISQEKAAELAGLDRTDFLLALRRAGSEAFQVDMTDLKRELSRG